jgi:hypothetical protein
MKNLSVTLGDVAAGGNVAQLTPQICLWPTFTVCHFITPQTCHYLISCLYPSGHCVTPTPLTCWTPTPDGCWTLSPDPCGHLSPVCELSMTPTVLETFKATTPVLAVASDKELDAIRADLERVIETARARGMQTGPAARPQTAAEVDMLERELKAALKEVQDMKKEMK